MSLLLALLFAPIATAADGYWHPYDLMSQSKAFARLNEGTFGPFDERSQQAQEHAQALANYRLALDLLGDRASSEERARLEALEKQFNRDKAVLEAFAGALIDDVDSTFRGAVDRALEPIEGEIIECEREIATGPQVPGMRQRTQKNPDCTGEDLNARIAGSLDRDPQLKADIDEIVALKWPDFGLDSQAQAAIGGGGRWVALRPLISKGAAEALKQIDRDDENARLPFQSAIEEGADKAELERLAADAVKIDATTAARRAALAGPVMAAAEKSLAKWGEAAGWCANPVSLGGCEGDNATSELLPKLIEDPRVSKSLRKASEAVGG